MARGTKDVVNGTTQTDDADGGPVSGSEDSIGSGGSGPAAGPLFGDTGGTTGELPPDLGAAGGSGAAPGGTGRKRGRPKGSGARVGGGGKPGGQGSEPKPKPISRAELRRQLVGTTAGLTEFGFGAFAVSRAKRYRNAPQLAEAVRKCWTVTSEQAATIGDPLADILAKYLPDAVLAGVAEVGAPMQLLAAGYMICKQAAENEQSIVAQWNAHVEKARAAQPAADEIPPDDGPTVQDFQDVLDAETSVLGV